MIFVGCKRESNNVNRIIKSAFLYVISPYDPYPQIHLLCLEVYSGGMHKLSYTQITNPQINFNLLPLTDATPETAPLFDHFNLYM